MSELVEGSLKGIKVLDFSTLLPGPLASLFLAETGAEVIKIEKPIIGDEMRSSYPKWNDESISFSMLNRGKKSLCLDLKDKNSLKVLKPLIEKADILIEQFRPGVMKRLGLDYANIKKINNKIIYVSITGYGQTGPKKMLAGHDLNYIGNTGLLSLSMGSDENTTVPPALVADIAGGSYPAIINILLALRKRDLHQTGSYLDISMSDNLFPFMFWALGSGFVKNKWPINSDSLLSGGSPRYNIYQTKDGSYIAAAPLEDRFWKKFCEVIKLPNKFINMQNNQNEIIKRIRNIIISKDKNYWTKVFDEADCCCSTVKSIEEAINDNHFKIRNIFEKKIANDEGEELPALPIPIDNQFRKKKIVEKAPKLGFDNDTLYK
ncbi:MAG: CoA transferase [Alphaproteobacteria bacterium]|jgi:crotonobetainyl-CoA:carnitine CoA-transferase CaiB-like acyl-CoA transferase|nr:CoA transferase [Alphaproteobacteria bacterium]